MMMLTTITQVSWLSKPCAAMTLYALLLITRYSNSISSFKMTSNTSTGRCSHIGGCNAYHLKMQDLQKTFGNKKAKKKVEKMELLAIKDTSFADDIVLDNHDDVTEPLLPSSVIPQMKANAETVEEMYDIHNIVSDTILETLQLDHFIDNSNGHVNKDTIPYEESTFIIDEIRKAHEENDHRSCKLLVYASYLMALFARIRNFAAAHDTRMLYTIKNPKKLITKHLQERYTHNPAMQVLLTSAYYYIKRLTFIDMQQFTLHDARQVIM